MRHLISVIGLGYVGLSTAVCLASRNIETIGVEIDKKKLSAIRSGIVPFHEQGLEEMLKKVLAAKKFACSGDISYAVCNTEITIIAVGTPSKPDGEIETTFVREACIRIAEAMKKKGKHHIVVVKSTVVPGTTEGLVKHELESKSSMLAGKDFGLAVNPEFLREGTAVYDTFHPDALVLGCSDELTLTQLKKLFLKFYGRLPMVVETSPTNAELIKYSVNTFRAVQLSFINTLANLSSVLPNLEVGDVIRGLSTIMKMDERYLRPGPGFGGSCLPKDTRALVAQIRSIGLRPDVLQAALDINEFQPKVISDVADRAIGGLKKRRVAVLGLAFKANTDDVRESPSLALIRELLKREAEVTAYDPSAIPNTKAILGKSITYSRSAHECLKDAECCFIATDWKEFKDLKPEDFKKYMKHPIVIDGRRLFEPKDFAGKGIKYQRIGTSPAG